MSPVSVPSTATTIQGTPKVLPATYKHPLDPLSPDEVSLYVLSSPPGTHEVILIQIAAASLSIREYIARKTDVKAIKFITLYLLPPHKKVVLAHLGIPLSPGAKPEAPTPIIRRAEADVRIHLLYTS